MARFEPHMDDVTQVCFHPDEPELLFTGSVDGLVYVLDISLGSTEDEATIAMINMEQPISEIGFFGPSHEFLHCLTHIETFCLWDVATSTRIFNCENARERVSATTGIPTDYLLGFHSAPTSTQLVLLAGNSSGDVEMLNVEDNTLVAMERLSGGHIDTVRCFYWDPQSQYVITGGEDSRLCCWGNVASAREQQQSTARGHPPCTSGLKMRGDKHVAGFSPY